MRSSLGVIQNAQSEAGRVETGKLMRRPIRGARGRGRRAERGVAAWLSSVVLLGFAVSLALPGPAGAQTRPVASAKRMSSYPSLSKVHAAILAAEKATKPPGHVTPSISALAAEDDWGGDLQAASSCPTLGVSAATFDLSQCAFGDTSSTTVVALVGDSRAQMWLDGFNTLGLAEHFKVVLIAKSGCPVPTGTYETNNDNGTVSAAPWAACTTFHSFMASSLASLHPAVIVISSNYQLDLADPPHLATPAEVATDMAKFLKTLPAASTKIVLGGFPQPAPTASPTLCLSKGPKKISSCNFVPSSPVVAENAASQSAAKAAGADFINQTPWFCAATCPSIIASIIPYTIDGYHADKTYLNYLTGVLWGSLKPYLH
jgi:hypothetical protein